MLSASAISMISPFLLRAVLDTAIPEKDTRLLTELVLGMIGIAIATAAIGVWQTYISNVVGQRVMHDLRVSVYERLQRMSLAFFTRTRTGEVQSRIANDIGGIDSVVTFWTIEVAVEVTTLSTPPMSLAIRDCTSPVRVCVKNASDIRCRWA